ncbi:hypothetical protein OZ411_01670 [Bradyrhizobium sp. Arg237L]|uniref:hypothetical protein n=1 Tax=Bradyrhizobium sp. Arg237L TaxID=3003352 RepID=UPI00249E6DBE|nr:hypothetical protein [Bradyrhizobium sp. Arg237L]MDI4231521.1 hypothetical protein [Bradyrhizobium sp. Arg237L]
MADKKNVVATESGTGTQTSLQTKNRQAEEESRILDSLEDDEVREALDLLHARDDGTSASEG